jgi:hypothetical protein
MTMGKDLAARFQAACADLADYATSLDDAQWRTIAVNSPDIVQGNDEDRPVGVVVDHVIAWLPRIVRMIEVRVAGGEVPATVAVEIDRINAEHAEAAPAPDQAETIVRLTSRATEVARTIATLSDEELVRGPEGGLSAGGVTERLLIGHVTWHLGSIRATFASG